MIIVVKLRLCRFHVRLPLLFCSNIRILVSTNHRFLLLDILHIILGLLDTGINQSNNFVRLKSTIVQVLHSPLYGNKMIRRTLRLSDLLCRNRCRSLLLCRQCLRSLKRWSLHLGSRSSLRHGFNNLFGIFALLAFNDRFNRSFIFNYLLFSRSISHDGLEFFCRHFRRLAVNKSVHHITASAYKHYSVVALRISIHECIQLLFVARINLCTFRSLLFLGILYHDLIADLSRLYRLLLAVGHKSHQALALVNVNETLVVKHHLTAGDKNCLTGIG